MTLAAPPPAEFLEEPPAPLPDGGNGRTPAPTGPSGPAGTRDSAAAERGSIDQLLYGLVRDVRAEAQNIARAIAPVQAALDLADAATRKRELARALTGANRVLTENSGIIEQRLVRIRDVFAESPRLYDRTGDAVTTLENQWREVLDAVSWGNAPDAEEVRPRLVRAAAALREIEWQAGLISVPIRVNQHLQTKRIGGQLRFHDAFRDEIGDDERRTALLSYLAEHPASFSGVVDVPTGVIYRVAPQPWRRAASWIGLGLAATVGGYAVIWLLTAGLEAVGLGASIPGLGPGRAGELLAAYVGMLAGVLVHVVVEALKQAQRRGSGSFLALEDWFLWVHVRETALLVGILSVWAVLVGLALTLSTPGSISFITAFAVGYSLDSFLGLFITRFDTVARSAVEAATGRVTGS
jgi:hypothetical protein